MAVNDALCKNYLVTSQVMGNVVMQSDPGDASSLTAYEKFVAELRIRLIQLLGPVLGLLLGNNL